MKIKVLSILTCLLMVSIYNSISVSTGICEEAREENQEPETCENNYYLVKDNGKNKKLRVCYQSNGSQNGDVFVYLEEGKNRKIVLSSQGRAAIFTRGNKLYPDVSVPWHISAGENLSTDYFWNGHSYEERKKGGSAKEVNKVSSPTTFVWPNLSDEKKARNCTKEPADLDTLRKQNMITNMPDPTTTIYAAEKILDQIDLNGDGICELYVQNTSTSGTGGYIQGIFQKRGEKYELIADLFGFDLQLAEKKNGYYQFIYHEVTYEKSEKAEVPVLYQFNGQEYVRAKTPRWSSKKYNIKGVEKYKQKDYKTAILYFSNALRVRTLYNRGYDIKNNLALCYIKLKKHEKADQILSEILTSINNDSGYSEDAAAAYFNLGKIYAEKNDLNKALVYYKLSLDKNPSEIRRQKFNGIVNKPR